LRDRADRQRDKFASPHSPPAERRSNYLKPARLHNKSVCDVKRAWWAFSQTEEADVRFGS
jgi:hypothetical protein